MKSLCVFCQIVAKKAPAFIVYEDELTLAFLDKYPQSPGHTQLIPKKHTQFVYEISQIGQFFTTAQKISRGIIRGLDAHHVTFATFGHEIAHAHLWLVPQYKRSTALREGKGKSLIQAEEFAERLRIAIATQSTEL